MVGIKGAFFLADLRAKDPHIVGMALSSYGGSISGIDGGSARVVENRRMLIEDIWTAVSLNYLCRI
jgi:hypothetical protein